MNRLSCQSAACAAIALLACQPPQTVADDASVFDSGIIVCTIDDQCPTPQRCIGGICLERECESKQMCPVGKVCRDGRCSDPPAVCSGPEDCPGQLLCEGFSRTCIDPYQGACRTSFDCDSLPGCENGCNCTTAGTCVPLGQDAAVPATDAGLPPVDSGGRDSTVRRDAAIDRDAGGPVDVPKPDLGGRDVARRDTGGPGWIDLTGYQVENREFSTPQLSVIPDGVGLEPGQLLVIGRFAGPADFEDYWGVQFGANVVYITNTDENRVPMINGDEKWALTEPGGSHIVDGVTIVGSAGKSYQRIDADGASYRSSWSELADSDATPGTTDLPDAGVGLVISEWSDALGVGHYIYEFIEIYYAP